MWPWPSGLKEQLDRIERNQLRLALALKIADQLEQPPLGVPARVAPRAPRRKLTEADVHFATGPWSRPTPSPGMQQTAPRTMVDLDGQEPIINLPSAPSISPQHTPLPSAPLGSSASERPSPPSAPPPAAHAMHWRDSASLTNQLP